jgi:putative ABC transport system substrate-binding protein
MTCSRTRHSSVLVLTLLVPLASPLAAEAQQAGKVYRVGYLSAGSPGSSPRLDAAFREGLRDRGLVEGQNVIIEYRWAGAIEERYPTLLAELVGLKVDVIVTTSTTGALAAKRATTEIPIVFSG